MNVSRLDFGEMRREIFHHVEFNCVEFDRNLVGVCFWVRNNNELPSACVLTFAVESSRESCSTPTICN